MATVAQIPIQCQLSIISDPPVAPIDVNTEKAPKFWRGQDIAIAVGIFDADNVAIDLSNLTSLQLTFRTSPTAPYYLATKVVEAADIIPTIPYAGWLAGVDWQAMFFLSAGETDFSLDGGESAQVWMDIRGFTEDSTLVYGAGYVTVFNPGGVAVPARNLVWVDPPAAADSDGVEDQVAYDSSYFYVCVAADTWKRTPLATW